MSAVIHARVVEQLTRLRLRYVADRLDAVLNDAARTEPTYLDFLDGVLRQEVEAKQRTRVAMGLKIAHFPTVKTLDEFDFKFQPSVDQRLVRELATGRFLANAENVLIFGAPGVGKSHLAIVGNHTYSHRRYSRVTFGDFTDDVLRCEAVLRRLPSFRKLLRFPFLDEGATTEQRDRIRAFLVERGYGNAHVTIDASDWYVDGRLRARLERQRDADPAPYGRFYVDHIWERAQFYDGLSRQVLSRTVSHTVLLHHNMLNALFLGELIQMFKSKGWSVVDVRNAYEDPVFRLAPDVLPAGQSLLWSLAKATGRFDGILRYPGEDGTYEASKMDALGL